MQYIPRGPREHHDLCQNAPLEDCDSVWPDRDWADGFSENPLQGAYAADRGDEEQCNIFMATWFIRKS